MIPMEYDREHPQRRFQETSRKRYYLRWISGLIVALLALILLQHLFSKRPSPLLHTSPSDPSERALWSRRASRVKNAFVDAYSAYEEAASPHDELLPLSNGNIDNFNGWGVTMVDALDTMILMKLDDLSNRTIQHIAKLSFDQNQNVKFFETVIRYLGGLLSSYALSQNSILLLRADDLGRRLLPAFNTPSGLPAFSVNPHSKSTQNGWNGNGLFLSEIASCQLEYRYLAHLTGRPEYVKHVDRISNLLCDHQRPDGLLPLAYSLLNGEPQEENKLTVSAFADSGYEYLLKQWVLTNRTEPKFREMYVASANGIINELLYLSPSRQLLYVTDVTDGVPSGTLAHLACFLAGLFSLGVTTIPDLPPRHAWAAEGLAHTCYITYADSQTGIGPDQVVFEGSSIGGRWVEHVDRWEKAGRHGGVPPGVNQAVPVSGKQSREYVIRDPYNPLRPETIESFYILWRNTKDSKWRDRGWELFQAIERYGKTEHGFTSLLNVDVIPPLLKDEMPSFFLAETLKYLYLLFTDEDLVPLNKWTFNTEAHPLPVFEWSDWEKGYYGIS